MRALYFDCFSGAAGDMLVGALLDLGAPLEALREDLAGLRIEGFEVDARRCWRGGLAGTRFEVAVDPALRPPRRNLADILALLDGGRLPAAVAERAGRVFRRIGEAEAKVHGCSIDEVHFHEVGAIDSIVDVVGFCALHERLGAPPLLASAIALGCGFTDTAHGSLPVPAMATLELLRGVPVETGGVAEELCTPTGAALLAALCESFVRELAFVPRRVGYGLGSRERESPPNAVRVVDCEIPSGRAGIVVLETNLDDATGQELSRLIARCLEAGALDAVLLPAVMKKGRPGHVLQVLATDAAADGIESLLLSDTPALGVRRWRASRRELEREEREVGTRFGPVRVKVAVRPGGARQPAVEFDEIDRIARAQGIPLEQARRLLRADVERALGGAAD